MSNYHVSVLLQETIEQLQVQPGEKYIDATLGGGGHSEEIVRAGGIVLGIDQDIDAITFVQERLGDKITIAQGNFENVGEIALANGFEEVSGVLYDLGISSHQVDVGSRGFSFLKEAPLDMRMSVNLSVTAADLVNGLNKGELKELFERYGEEYFGRRIAEAIVREREKAKITTTTQLAQLVASHYPGGNHKVHPATKVFQALRIAVNDELYVLEKSLPQALGLLKKGGRLVVISFHSLEDRIIKNTFEKWEKEGKGKVMTKKPIIPSEEETEKNRRARSSKLRVFERA